MPDIGSKVTYGPYIEHGLRRKTVVELTLSMIVWDDSYAWVEDTRGKGWVITEKRVGKRTVTVAMGIPAAKDLLDHLEYYAHQFGPEVDRNLKQAYVRAAASVRQQMWREGHVALTGRIGY